VKEGEEEKEGRWAVNLEPVYAQEPKKFVRKSSGPYINSEGLNYYING